MGGKDGFHACMKILSSVAAVFKSLGKEKENKIKISLP